MSGSSSENSPYESVNALFGMLAAAFDLDADALARALEEGALKLDLQQDSGEARYITATLTENGQTRTAKLYRDAAFRETNEGANQGS